MKRTYVVPIAMCVLLMLAGCTNQVGSEDPEETVVQSDNGIEVANLEVLSEGERDCYHTLMADVTNKNNHTVENLEITITISDENGQVLSEFNTGYVEVGANETKELEVEHGPQKNQCWNSMDAHDYYVTANFSTPE